MAQLKDLLVAGPSRFIGDMFGNNLQINKIDAHTAAGGTTYGIGSAGQALCSDGTSVYWGYPTSSAHANLVTATNSVAYFTNTTGSFGSKPSANGALYATSANGALQWGTLPVGQGGTGKTSWTQWGVVYASAASTLANTAAGAANTALMGKGSAAPAFVSVSTTLATSTAATSSASQKIKVTVLGVASSELELTKATTGLYGTTKLTNSYSSTDESMATTGKALLAALQTLDVSAVGVAAATGNRYISQISETDGKISATLATATIGSGTRPIWIDGGTIKQTDYVLQANVYYQTHNATTNGWNDMHGRESAPIISVTRHNSTVPAWIPEGYSSSLLFGGADTKGMISAAYSKPHVVFAGSSTGGSTVDAPKWWWKLIGTSGHAYTMPDTDKTLVGSNGQMTVNTGTTNQVAYYSGTNAVSSNPKIVFNSTAVEIHPNGSGSYNEGLRMFPSTGNWTTIYLGGADLSGSTGTSTNSWGIYNNNGTLYINKTTSTTQQGARAMATSTGWTFGNTNLNSYALNTASFISADWVRTKGATGWYSQDYGGGWYMSDTTWIRSYGSKSIYQNAGILRTDGTLQVGADGIYFESNSTHTRINRELHPTAASSVRVGITPLIVFALKNGCPVYTDTCFATGSNSVGVYNNQSNGTVVHTRMTVADAGVDPGNGSNYVIRIVTNGAASPGIGGFVQGISARKNAVFVQIFRALIPTGRSLHTASNSMGTSYTDHWITSPEGTGKWEWYACIVHCGEAGSFSGGGHIYLDGAAATSDAPVTWYLSECNVYDITKGNYQGLLARLSDGVRDYNNGNTVTFGYSTAGMSSTSWLGSWDGYKLRAISPANITAGKATILATARTIWGQSFNGSANIAGDMTDVGQSIKLISGKTGFHFLTSSGGAATGSFGKIGINGTYANIDFTNYVLDVNGATHINGALNVNSDINLYTTSADTPDIVWWYANKSKEQARIWMGSGSDSIFSPFYRCYNSAGTNLFSGRIVIGADAGVGNVNKGVYVDASGVATVLNEKLGAINADGYWGMRGADNGDSWIRTTSAGIIPVQAGGIGSGHSGLGTPSWYFSSIYADTHYAHQVIIGGATTATMTSATTNPRITFQEGTGTQPVHLVYSDFDSYRSPAGLKVVGDASATPAWFEVEGNIYGTLKGNADTATAFSANKSITLTGAVTGTASSTGGWTIATIGKYLDLYEARGTTTTLNKAANYVKAGAMFHLVASSSTSATNNGKTPTDANILQMNWDNNGGYDSQFGIATGESRAYFRQQVSSNTAWREFAHIAASTQTGSDSIPVYVNNVGSVTALTNYVHVSIHTIPAAKGVRITYPSQAPVLISVQRSNNGGRLILIGGGYGAGGTTRNDFTEVVSSAESNFTWSLPSSDSISCSIEVMNHNSSGGANVIVWSKAAATFTEITTLSTPQQNHKLLNSLNYTNYTVTKTGSGASGTWGISISGNAATATALASNAGSTTQPIYFTGGKPAATTYALKATVNNATQWGVAYYSTTTNITSTAAGTAGYPLIGAGSAAPIWYGGQVNTGTAAASWKTSFNGTTDSTSATTGTIAIDGGIGVAKNIWSNGFIKSGGFTSDTTVTSGVFKPAITIYPSNSNEINFGGYYTGNRNIYFGYRKVNDREIPTNYNFGPYSQISLYVGEVAAGTTKETYITLGNNKATSDANNGRGRVRMYGTNAYYSDIIPTDQTAHRAYYLTQSPVASAYLLSYHVSNGDLNTIYDAGMFTGTGSATNGLDSNGKHYSILSVPYNKAGGNTGPNWGWQIGTNTGNNDGLFFRLASSASAWRAWRQIVHIAKGTGLGSGTKPVYVADTGAITECSSYAGGTAVTLNNASKAASTASFYAPTAGGANNTQALVGAGTTTAPKWVNISPSCAWTAGTTAGPSLKVTVLGQTQGTGAAIPAASASASGVVLATTGTTEQWFKGWKGIYNECAIAQGTTAIDGNACTRFMLRCKNITTGHNGGTGVIRLFNNNQADDNNATMTIDCAGDLYIGGGEAPYNVLVAKGITNGENMYIVTDANTFIESNAGTAANRIGIVINTSGHLYPQKAEANNSGQQDLGTTNSRWRALYVDTIDINQFHAGHFTANTAQSVEGQCGVRGGAGTLYLYSQTGVNTHRGLYGCNSAGTNAGYLTINKDNRINGLAPLELTSSSWWNQRTNARIRCDMSTGNNVLYPLWSMLTVNGNWALGTYSTTADPDRLLFTYITNTQFNAGTNPSSFPAITLYPDGTILNSGYYRTTKYGTSAPTATAPNGSLYFVYKA